MKTFTKVTIVVIIFIVVIAGFFIWRALKNNDEGPRTVTAERLSVIQDVTFTGQLESQTNTSLGFEVPGKISEILVSVGEKVIAGQSLVKLDTTLAQLELAQANANQSSAEYEKYLTWQKSLTTYENTKSNNARTLATKRQAVRDAKAGLDQAREVHQQTVIENGDASSVSKTAHSATLLKESVYHAAQQALEESIKSVNKSSAAAKDSADIASAQHLATKQSAGNIAGLSSLDASRALAQARLNKTSLVASSDGIITAINNELGETVLANAIVIEIQTTDSLKISANVSESEATKLNIGMSTTITLDAYPTGESLSAKVSAIAPAAVIIEGIPTYETTLILDSQTSRLKPGLTTNITVHAAQHNNVIAVPRRAVINKEEKQLIRILGSDGHTSEIEVTTGLLGSDGNVEISSGLTEGDRVVIGN
jgi:RND family efflux transporter MFP subunit